MWLPWHLQVLLRESRFLAGVSQSSARMPMKEDTQQSLSLSLSCSLCWRRVYWSIVAHYFTPEGQLLLLTLPSHQIPGLRVSLHFLPRNSQKQKVRKHQTLCAQIRQTHTYTVVKHKTNNNKMYRNAAHRGSSAVLRQSLVRRRHSNVPTRRMMVQRHHRAVAVILPQIVAMIHTAAECSLPRGWDLGVDDDGG